MSKQERNLTIVLAAGTLLTNLCFFFKIDQFGVIGKLIIAIPIIAICVYCYYSGVDKDNEILRKRIKRIILFYVLMVVMLAVATRLYGDNVPNKAEATPCPTPSPTLTPTKTDTPDPVTPEPTQETTPTPTAEPVTPSPTPSPFYSQQTIDTFDAGYRYYMAENYDAAFPLFLEAASAEYPKAALYLGTCYQESKGVEQNSYAAFDWFTIAADSGLARAQYRLGYCYHTGFGVFQSEELAFKWFLKSAEQNDDLGLLWTGYCYQYGKGVPQDYDLAAYYYTASRDLGNNDAQRRLSDLRRVTG